MSISTMSNPITMSETTLNELMIQAQDQRFIQAVELLWESTGHDINKTAQLAFQAHHPTLLMLATALRAVTAGTPAVTPALIGTAMANANTAWPAVDCRVTADVTSKSFPGLCSRRFFGDMSNIPAIPNDGILSSPDIIVSGTSPLPDPSQLLTKWNQDSSVRPIGDKKNHAYVRGINLFPGTQEGKVYLYYAPANITNNPSKWIPLNTIENGPYSLIKVSNTGNLWYSDKPFVWTPKAGEHHCLISRIETSHYPNPLPGGNIDPGQWVSNSPAIAWHNQDALVGALGAHDYTLEYGNTGTSTGKFLLVACVRNAPSGVSLRLHSETGEVGFDTHAVAITKPRQEVAVSVDLPANFWGKLTATIDNQTAKDLPPETCVDIRFYRNVSEKDNTIALRARALGIRTPLAAFELDDHFVLVGSFALIGSGFA